MVRIYKTRQFAKWAEKENVDDAVLTEAVAEIGAGLVDADLGGCVLKKRVVLPGRGKRSGARTLLAYRHADRAFFIFGFTKNERENISDRELKALKLLASSLLGSDSTQLRRALDEGVLIEVKHGEQTTQNIA